MKRSTHALVTLVLLAVSFALPASALRVGLDNRNGVEAGAIMGSGDQFDELRALITGLGHTIVTMDNFEASDFLAADLDALFATQTYTQTGGGYTGSEITAIQSFVSGGGGLALYADAGLGFEAASMDSLASAFGVSFAAAGSEPSGHEITLFESHPLTAGLGSLPGTGLCIDFQRVLTVGPPAVDLTTLGGANDALAAVDGVGGAGNVAILSDTSAFKDPGVSFDTDIDLCNNRLLLENVVNYTAVPEPGTAALLGLGLAASAALRKRNRRP